MDLEFSPEDLAFREEARRFIAENRQHLRGDDYAALYDWSTQSPAEFWAAVWRFCARCY